MDRDNRDDVDATDALPALDHEARIARLARWLGEAEALRLSSSMGGGVGGLREVCGAFCGMSMALGALRGYDSPTDLDSKKAHYARIQQKAEQFRQAYGTVICRELLKLGARLYV